MSSFKAIVNPALRAAAHVRSSNLPKELSKSAAALLSSAPSGGKHVLPDLPYDYNALERKEIKVETALTFRRLIIVSSNRVSISLYRTVLYCFISIAVISAETMTLHHSKHHNTYVTNLNVALEKLDAAASKGDVSGIIALQGALKFNGGGHVNHTLFWENLGPEGNSQLKSDSALTSLIESRYGDVESMKKELAAMTIAVQGSGWGWLGYNSKTGEYLQTSSQTRVYSFINGALHIFFL